MKPNGNHHASAILRTFTHGNLRQRTGNFNSFLAMYGTPRYDVTSRITRLILMTNRMEVVLSYLGIHVIFTPRQGYKVCVYYPRDRHPTTTTTLYSNTHTHTHTPCVLHRPYIHIVRDVTHARRHRIGDKTRVAGRAEI